MRRLVALLLAFVERLYLRTHGWEHIENDTWAPPLDYDRPTFDEYHRAHAINSQRARQAAVTRKAGA